MTSSTRGEELSVDTAKIDVFLFDAGDTSFGAEVNQIISITRSSEKMGQSHESITLVDLSTKLKTRATVPLAIPRVRTSRNHDNTRGSSPVILLVSTDKGITGAYVESAKGVISMPLEQIEPLPEFLKSRIETDCIWGIGKLGRELIVLIDLGEYLSRITHVVTQSDGGAI